MVFNDEHEGEAGEPRITELLEALCRQGFGGVFLHARGGLMTEYLSPRWFELIRHAVRECVRLGMTPYLYDEDAYPSGKAGGHVAARVPEARSRHVAIEVGDRPSQMPRHPLQLRRVIDGELGDRVEADELERGQPWAAFVLRDARPSSWFGEFPYPSLLDPRAALALLESTHERYRAELGDELWTAVAAMFTDEPELMADGAGIHLTPYVFARFRQRLGYDLREHLESLYFDTGDFQGIRYDFFDLMHRLWLENWILPLEAWCEEHGIAFTGHFLDEHWPIPYATPGWVQLAAHMHWPGTDLLGTFELLGHDSYGGPRVDGEGLWPSADGSETHMLMQLRQCAGVANQLAKSRVMNEPFGVGGNDSTPADFLRIGRWLTVHGVDLFVCHLSLMTIRGVRKTDCPQTFSEHSAWFRHIRPVMDELARLSWVGAQGRVEHRVLVLDPLTTGFCLARRGDDLDVDLLGDPVASELIEERARSRFGPIQRDFGRLVQSLSDAQVDFDTGDEYVIEESGRVEERRLNVGVQSYQLVVWPEHMTNLRARTAEMLSDYLDRGGQLIGVRPASVTVDGRPSDLLARWDARFADRCRWVADRDELVAEVVSSLPPRIRFATAPSVGLAHLRRVTADGELIIVVNSSPHALDSAFELETERSHRYELDPRTGEVHPLADRVLLEPRAATVIWATDRLIATRPRSEPRPGAAAGVPVAIAAIERTSPNVLVVDTCELRTRDSIRPSENVFGANQRYWAANDVGQPMNGWTTIQYRDQILARNAGVPSDSGGTATYRFDIDPDVRTNDLRLAIETPELWEISVNGRSVDVAGAGRWLDVRIRAIDVGRLLRPGENVVQLRGIPLDLRREIQPIYVVGDFRCEESESGFRVVPDRPMRVGRLEEPGVPVLRSRGPLRPGVAGRRTGRGPPTRRRQLGGFGRGHRPGQRRGGAAVRATV